jgi:putative hemolysin
MAVVLLLLIAFVLGIYFSAMETVYTSFDRILVMGWLRARKFGSKSVEFLSSHPERFLGTTLIGNNLTNVAYSSLLVMLAESRHVGPVWLMTVSPLFVLVFSEILPKMIGMGFANRIICWLSPALLAAYWVLSPFRLMLLPASRLLMRKSDPEEEAVSGDTLALRRELDQILGGAEAEGAVTAEEGDLLERFLDARDLKARQIMTPRTQLVAVREDAAPDDVRQIFQKSRYDILPVYSGDLDHIIGYVRALDFLNPSATISRNLMHFHAVPESKPLVDLLDDFRRNRRRVVLVIDEYGGTDGLVTLKDIFEELVGPVSERFHESAPMIHRISSTRYLVNGTADLESIELATGWVPPVKESLTLSGLLAEQLGRIAELGEDISFDGVIVRVIRRSPRRVEGCLIKLPAPPVLIDD